MVDRISKLPVDKRGFVVPFFVAWVNGQPDHRIVDPTKLHACIVKRLCWICGEPLGVHLSFVIGPMCGVNRTSSEPPQHLECSRYAMTHCPFITRPHMRRREKGLPVAEEMLKPAAGYMLEHNPGVSLLWTTRRFNIFQPQFGSPGILFHLGDPEHIEFYKEGRTATRQEINDSINIGLPALIDKIRTDKERIILEQQLAKFEALLPLE